MYVLFIVTDNGDDSGTNLGAAFTKILEHMSFIKARKPEQFLNSSHVIIMFTDGKTHFILQTQVFAPTVYIYTNIQYVCVCVPF